MSEVETTIRQNESVNLDFGVALDQDLLADFQRMLEARAAARNGVEVPPTEEVTEVVDEFISEDDEFIESDQTATQTSLSPDSQSLAESHQDSEGYAALKVAGLRADNSFQARAEIPEYLINEVDRISTMNRALFDHVVKKH